MQGILHHSTLSGSLGQGSWTRGFAVGVRGGNRRPSSQSCEQWLVAEAKLEWTGTLKDQPKPTHMKPPVVPDKPETRQTRTNMQPPTPAPATLVCGSQRRARQAQELVVWRAHASTGYMYLSWRVLTRICGGMCCGPIGSMLPKPHDNREGAYIEIKGIGCGAAEADKSGKGKQQVGMETKAEKSPQP